MSISSSESTKRSDTAKSDNPKNIGGWAKTVGIHFRAGTIDCDNENHYVKAKAKDDSMVEGAVKVRKGDSYPLPVGPIAVLEEMKPFELAKCKCQRTACKAAWEMNALGCLQTEFVARGAYHKGVGDMPKHGIAKRVAPIPFRLKAGDFEELHNCFPDWHFVQCANAGHDHPISHVKNTVVTHEIMSQLRPGSYLDLHGNPSANENAPIKKGVTVDTAVSLQTAKDWIRKLTKWGPEMKGDRRRYTPIHDIRDIGHTGLNKGRTGFLSFHTLYYYSMSEVVGILKGSPDATLTATMHRFRGNSGEFNKGELKWTKDVATGMITQTNVKTGESYVHPDNNVWFDQTSWIGGGNAGPVKPYTHKCTAVFDASGTIPVEHCINEKCGTMEPNPVFNDMGSLTWTLNEACEDVYRVTVGLCPNSVAYGGAFESGAKRLNSLESLVAEGGVTITDGDRDVFVPIKAQHAQLFDDCRALMCNKTRDDAKFKAHCSSVAVKAKSALATSKIPVAADELATIQMATFWVDLYRDYTGSTVAVNNDFVVRQYDMALKGKDIRRTGNLLHMVLDTVILGMNAKSGKDTIKAVTESIRLFHSKLA